MGTAFLRSAVDVIRIALKWLIGLLCGYVITTTAMTQAHHIQHQLEAYVVMMSRLFLVKMLHSHNDNNIFFKFVLNKMYLNERS